MHVIHKPLQETLMSLLNEFQRRWKGRGAPELDVGALTDEYLDDLDGLNRRLRQEYQGTDLMSRYHPDPPGEKECSAFAFACGMACHATLSDLFAFCVCVCGGCAGAHVAAHHFTSEAEIAAQPNMAAGLMTGDHKPEKTPMALPELTARLHEFYRKLNPTKLALVCPHPVARRRHASILSCLQHTLA